MNDLEKFWHRVNKTNECWTWHGGVSSEGYGRYWINGRQEYAHKLSWQMVYGKPKSNIYMKCKNKLCIKPEHLTYTKPAYLRTYSKKVRKSFGRRTNWDRLWEIAKERGDIGGRAEHARY